MLSVLEYADLMVIFTCFMNRSYDEMQCVEDYLTRGVPVVGLRTATHAFSNMDNPEWAHYSYNYDGPQKEWANSFGKLILGETWVSHYGANHKQASRLDRKSTRLNSRH